MSEMYMNQAKPICLSWLVHEIDCAFSRAFARAGNSIDAKMAMMAMTTSNSMSVNLCLRGGRRSFICLSPFPAEAKLHVPNGVRTDANLPAFHSIHGANSAGPS